MTGVKGVYGNTDVFIQGVHEQTFRSGQWAKLLGVVVHDARLCFVVSFIDGELDLWPVYDPGEPYKFASILPAESKYAKS